MVEDKNHLGQTVSEYRVCKRDSYIIVAQLSTEFTARLVDRWQELESAQAMPVNLSPARSGYLPAPADVAIPQSLPSIPACKALASVWVARLELEGFAAFADGGEGTMRN